MQINTKKKAESLAAVIISVFILSIALLGIMNIVSFSKDTAIDYETEMFKHIIKSNSEVLLNKLETSNLENEEEFYIYKDTVNKNFEIMTGSTNSGSMYINELGSRINNLEDGIGKTYKRLFTYKSDILKHRIDPPEIPNIIFHYDAQNINGIGNSNPTNGSNISVWKDLSGNGLDAYNNNTSNQPIFRETDFNGYPIVEFDTNDAFTIDNHELINEDDSNVRIYDERSSSIVLVTGDDVVNPQTIYEEGGGWMGYSFVLHNYNIYAGIWNNQEWDSSHQYKSVSLGEALPNTPYYITIVQDSKHSDDSINNLQIFLNGHLVSEQDHVDAQEEHPDVIGLGAINGDSVRASDLSVISNSGFSEYFNGGVVELMSWNHALTKAEVRGIHNYLLEKGLDGKQNVNYSVIETNISKYNSN